PYSTLCRSQLVHADHALIAPRGENGRLIDQVLQVCADHARRLRGDRVQVDIGRQWLAARMYLQDRLAAAAVGPVDDDLAVETTGAQQGWVEDVGPVGGGDDNDVGFAVEAVHLDQNLVERLLALVIAAAQPCTAMSPHGIDLVDEDDTRRI